MHETDTPKTVLPPPWAQAVSQAVTRYAGVRCEHRHDELVYVRNGLPMPIEDEDRVVRGFARKTAERLRHICRDCGRPAKARPTAGGWLVQCGRCHGRTALSNQIDCLLREATGDDLSPFDGRPAMWHEHDMPAHLCSCIPNECWRRVQLQDGRILHYLAREDVLAMEPWLRNLKRVMDSCRH